MNSPVRIAIIVGSTRPQRRGGLVAHWVHEVGQAHGADVEIVDLAAQGLPLLDEPAPAIHGRYENAHTLSWAETIARFDAFVFVVPEYNHSFPAAVKNAIDYLFAEWNDKAAGLVGYGVQGGIRAVEALRLVLAEVKVADVRTQVCIDLKRDFVLDDPADVGRIAPASHQEAVVRRMFDEVTAWAGALATLRVPA